MLGAYSPLISITRSPSINCSALLIVNLITASKSRTICHMQTFRQSTSRPRLVYLASIISFQANLPAVARISNTPFIFPFSFPALGRTERVFPAKLPLDKDWLMSWTSTIILGLLVHASSLVQWDLSGRTPGLTTTLFAKLPSYFDPRDIRGRYSSWWS